MISIGFLLWIVTMLIKHVLLVIFSFIITACADTHSLQVAEGSSTAKLDMNSSVLIGRSKDGEYGKHY